METLVEFVVTGKAEPAGSKRAVPNKRTGRAFVIDANPKAQSWKKQVGLVASEVFSGPLADGPLRFDVTFYSPRPKGHFGTGRNSGVLKPSAPKYPATRPDATKLLRGVEDALTGIVWRDDAQIVDQHVFKRYGEPARAEIRVYALDAERAGEIPVPDEPQLALVA